MARPTTRVLALLELLQTHRRMTGAELAARLEVDGRTLRRYIAALEDLGIPILAERGRYGGYMLMPGYKVPPLMFTQEETLAVGLGLVAARRLGLGDRAAAIESAQAKLERVMPAPLQKRLRALGETVALDLPAPSAPVDDATLATLAEAIRSARRVRLDYQPEAGAATTRDVDPYGLVYRRGRWYVSGHCHLRRDLRSFRLDRIRQVQLVDAYFGRPAHFDAAAHLGRRITELPRAIPVSVLLHTDLADAMSDLGESLGTLAPVEGGVLLQARTDSLAWFARQLARLGCRFTVLAPPGLRQAVRRHARRLLAAAEARRVPGRPRGGTRVSSGGGV